MNNFVYHYTSMEAVPSIVNRENLCFWATHHRFLNDPNEGVLGKRLLDEFFPEYSSLSMPDAFILSLSQDINSIPMWSSYANKARGVALKINKNVLSPNIANFSKCFYGEEAKESFKRFANFYRKSHCYPLELSKDASTKLVATFLKYFIGELSYIGLLCGAKDGGYRYEKEERFWVIADSSSNIKFRVRGDVIIPYVDIYMPKNALEEIVIGPANNSELIESSLRFFLANNGYPHVKISKSNLQYRG